MNKYGVTSENGADSLVVGAYAFHGHQDNRSPEGHTPTGEGQELLLHGVCRDEVLLTNGEEQQDTREGA